MIPFRILSLSLSLLFAFIAGAQGLVDGFFNGKNSYTAVLGGGYEYNERYLAGDRGLDLEKSFSNINAFVAYGLNPTWDLNIAAAYVKSGDEKGFQDARIATKFKVYETQLGAYQLSAQLAAGGSFPLSAYQTEGLNAIGQRAFSLQSRFLIHAQNKTGFFLTTQTGYDYKFEPVPNAVVGSLKVGLARSNYYLDAFIDVQNSVDGADYRGSPAPNNFRELEVDFMRVGLTFYKPLFSFMGVYLNTAYTLDGRNVGLGPAVNMGIVYKSKL